MGRALILLGLLPLASLALLPGGRATAQTPPTCGSFGPYDFDTYEAQDYRGVYSAAIQLAAEGHLFPTPITAAGETADFSYPGLESGPRGDRKPPSRTLRVPPTILKAIVWVESSWQQASNVVPWGGVGPALRSFDCGYGLGQVTSGMANGTGTPTLKQALVGTHYLFNLAESVRILASKWNAAPEVRPVAGKGDPTKLEDWYFAIWGYNGFAFVNHPLNPDRDPLRGEVYHCGDPSAPGYGAFVRSDYTYQEVVYGCMRYPPVRGGVRMWQPIAFNMPAFEHPAVASAFEEENYLDCAVVLLCNGMDFPTTLPDLGPTPHSDPAPPLDAPSALLSDLLGAPVLSVVAPESVTLTSRTDGTSDTFEILVRNTGTRVAPFRVRTNVPWLRVRTASDVAVGSTRTLEAGVAVGSDVEVVIVTGVSTQRGYDARLIVDLDRSKLPNGVSHGQVVVEPLFGGGAGMTISVSAVKAGSASGPRIVIPGVVRN